MENKSGDAVENPSGEVDRLQEELCKANERLQVWKEKTQMGVNKLRSRIVELTDEIEELRVTNKRLCEQAPCASTSGEVTVSSTPLSLGLWCAISEWLSLSADVFTSFTIQKSFLVLEEISSSDATAKELEKCKRRAAQAIRLQAKNVEVLQEEISTLRNELNVSATEIRDRNHAVESRDQAISMLQNRLDEMEAAKAHAEAACGVVINKPNADQLNMLEERLETDMESLRREFASREAVIFEQHRDEIERLLAVHEEGVSALRAELEEAAAKPVAEFPIAVLSEPRNDVDDSAYAELLRDFEAIRNEVVKVRAENQRLTSENQLRNARDRLGAPVANGSTARPDPETLPEAITRIAELESSRRVLSQELCEAKKRLVATKHQASTEDAGQLPQAVEGEHLAYLSSIVARLISSTHDESMVVKLFPVLNTLLQFNAENLKSIFAAYPALKKQAF